MSSYSRRQRVPGRRGRASDDTRTASVRRTTGDVLPNTLSRESIPNTLSGVGASRPVKPRRARLSGVSAAVLVAFLVALAYLLWR